MTNPNATTANAQELANQALEAGGITDVSQWGDSPQVDGHIEK
jgi:hypothetical protein